MDKEKRNFTSYVYGLLWIIWAGTFLSGAVLIYFNYSTQNRYLKVEAVQIDFESPQRQASGYTIGGFIPDATETAPFSTTATNTECSGSGNNVESDIILPTQLIPVNIGRLEYNSGNPRLQLNNCLDYEGNSDKLLSRVAYPRVLVNGKKISEKTISYDALQKGIVISYAIRENQQFEIRLEPIIGGNKKYKLFISPRPNHLQYVFREDGEQQTTKFNFIYGKKLSYKNLSECDSTDAVLFHYNSPVQQSKIISINKESASVDNQPFTGEYLLDGQIYLKYSPREGAGILVTYVIINVLFLLAFCFFPVQQEGKWISYRELVGGDEISGNTFIFLLIPVLVLAVFYNVGGILLSHYYFKFERYEYFFPMSSGLSLNWINYLTTGVILPLFFVFLLCPKISIGNLLEKIANYVNNLNRWKILTILTIVFLILNFLWATSDNQRVLSYFPSHVVVRLFTILFYFLAGLFFVKRQGWLMGVTLFILCILCVSTEDTGFAFLSIGTFFLIVAFNSKLKREGKIIFFILPIIFIIGAFYIFSSFSPNDYRTERFKLVYTDYSNPQSENASSIENANKETTDKHRIILHEAFTSNFWHGHLWNLRLPPEFKTVIWSDYILLYSFLYFGGFWTIVLVAVPLLILIIYLIKIGKLFYYDLPNDKEHYSIKRRVLSVVIGFVLFSYAAQMLYMLLAMFRVVPLTGQSIPFLSLSRFENIFIIFFIALTYIIIFSLEPHSKKREKVSGSPQIDFLRREEKGSNKTEKNDDFGYVELKKNFLDRFTAFQFLGLGTLPIVLMCFIGWWANNSLPDYADGTRYLHKNTEKEKIFNRVLSKLSSGHADSDGNVDINKVIRNTETKKLVEYFDEAIDEVTNRSIFGRAKDYYFKRSITNAHILQVELAKTFYGRESKLKPAEDTFIFEDTKPTVNTEKFIARLSYRREPASNWRLNDQKIRVVRNDNDFYINFNSPAAAAAVRPTSLAHIYTDQTYNGGGEILLDENSRIYTRKINGEERLQFCRADIYGTLPISIADSERLENRLTIDERLQVLAAAAIQSYSSSNGIMGGGIVVMDKDGNVKALASYPSLSPNALPGDKADFRAKNKNLAGGKSLYLFPDSPSVPLTAYPVASTWKMILGGAAVLADNSECNDKLAGNLIPSANPYFERLMERMLNPQNNVMFKQRLENDFDIYFGGNGKYSGMMFDTPWLPQFETVKNNPGIRDRIAIGHGDCRIPLIALVRSLSRIVTGKKVKPEILGKAEKEAFEEIQGNEIFICYKDILKKTSFGGGTAVKLREARYGDSKVFSEDAKLYAKTGTYGEMGKGVQQTYVIFGTDNYFFGVILNEKPSKKKHAINLARDFLPYVKAYAPQYLQ